MFVCRRTRYERTRLAARQVLFLDADSRLCELSVVVAVAVVVCLF